ncbi:hypothetical protein KJ854_01405 [Patescibacteria group bacterium]|nr:hypothetical protein [Patescibacteria group bacterium]
MLKENQKIITINKNAAKLVKNLDVFENIEYSYNYFENHLKIFKKLKNRELYTITVIIDNLKPSLYKNKKYAARSEYPIQSKYLELLYQYFFEDFGDREGNEFYAKLLDKYRPIWNKEKKTKEIDDYIIKNELEPRYKSKIIKRYRNLAKLKKPRKKINWDRYYNLPKPLNHVDWRNFFDNIFVWKIDNKKYCIRGGGGSSQQRENNTKFIYGFSMINKVKPIPSYLFLYTSKNQIKKLNAFNSLTVPERDIGHNYHIPNSELEKILRKTKLIDWKLS